MAVTERAARQGGPQTEYQHLQDKSRELAGRRSEWMCKVIRSNSLKDSEKLTLLRLALYFRGGSRTAVPSMRAWPSQEELGRQRGVSERTIRRHLARAEKVGFIFIEGREGGVWSIDGEIRGRPNYYYLSLPGAGTLDDEDDDGGDDDGGDGGEADDHNANGDDELEDEAQPEGYSNLDAKFDASHNLDTDIRLNPCEGDDSNNKPGQNAPDTRTNSSSKSDTWRPPHMNPTQENPTKESFNNASLDPSVASFFWILRTKRARPRKR
jgi:hypothetical protein